MCGEKLTVWLGLVYHRGSPPRVRGKACMPLLCLRHAGITPACAGKRLALSLLCLSPQDHPRVCGEKALFGNGTFYGIGSPPRVRGKAIALPPFSLGLGITPACAGKSDCFSTLHLKKGITPACAGKSASHLISTAAYQDHPRVCGEKITTRAILPAALGSPPRVRGKEQPCSSGDGNEGITPACAGKRVTISQRHAVP